MIVQEAQDFRIGAGCCRRSGKPVLGQVDLPHFVGIFRESVPRMALKPLWRVFRVLRASAPGHRAISFNVPASECSPQQQIS